MRRSIGLLLRRAYAAFVVAFAAWGEVGCQEASSPSSNGASPIGPLRVRYLGVGGFFFESGGEGVLAAPLFTRPTLLDLSSGTIASDPATVERSLPTPALANVRAILSGHAHYDHLLDVPPLLARAPQATLFANRSARNIMTAFAPERPARCAGTPAAWPPIPRARVVALDDPFRSTVDWTFCADRRPPSAPMQGSWVRVPGAHVRILAVCSGHPDQLGPLHYAPGGVDEEQCAPPRRADEWREGQTLAFVVDFLDPQTDAPVYRVYYQDAPSNAPNGHVPPAVLAEKRIDLAVLCVGAFERVNGAPSYTLGALQPRYALGGHWEDFFRPYFEAPLPIPLLDLNTWTGRARGVLPPQGDRPMLQNGAVAPARVVVPRAGDLFEIVP